MIRRALDHALAVLARTILGGFFRQVEVHGDVSLVRGRPVLAVANHFYGGIDAVVLVHVFGRAPRFLGKSTLFRVLPLRPLLALLGVLPVARPQDGSDTGENTSIFAACEAELLRRGLVCIFPEGTTHEHEAIREVRTGAARIALGAYDAGATDLAIVPVGLAFDDKVALRSRVVARVGRAIDVEPFARQLAAAGREASEEDREAVRELTLAIEARLREVAPDYRDARTAKVLRRAAEVVLRAQPGADPDSLGEQEALARRIAAAGPVAVDEVETALARYHLDLDIAGIGDLQVEQRDDVRSLLLRTLVASSRIALLTPFALFGLAWNVVPYTVVQIAGRLVPRPVTKGTVRLASAFVLFPTTWIVIAANDVYDGFWPGLLVFLLAPALGIVAVAWMEMIVKGYRDWRGWIGLTDRRALLPGIEVARAGVVDAVARALDDRPPAPL